MLSNYICFACYTIDDVKIRTYLKIIFILFVSKYIAYPTYLIYSMIDSIVAMVKEKKVFKRNKVPVDIKVIAGLIYQSGLSYRKVSMLGRFSHESVRLWYNALRKALPIPD